MLSDKFTLLQLTDLALKVPEVGAVNFNILHTVLTALIAELGLADFKTPCRIEDEALAQALVTRAKLEKRDARKRQPSKVHTVSEMKKMLKDAKGHMAGEETSTPGPVSEEETGQVSEVQKSEEADTDETGAATKEEDTEDLGVTIKQEDTEDLDATTKQEDTEDLDVTTKQEDTEDLDVTTKQEDTEDLDVTAKQEDTEEMDITPKQEDTEEDTEVTAAEESSPPGVLEEDQEADDSGTEEDSDPEVENVDGVTIVGGLEIAEEVIQDTAREILEKKTDVLVEAVAQRILEEGEGLMESPEQSSGFVGEFWRATNLNRRMDAAEASIKEMSRIMDFMMDKVSDLEDQAGDDHARMEALFKEIEKYLGRIKALEEACKTLDLGIQNCNEQRILEVERLEGIINDLTKEHEETKSTLGSLSANLEDLAARVAYGDDLEELREQMSEALDSKIRDVKRLLNEVEETLVKKEDFGELVVRVEELEETKISREELGRLLEPGFIDSFLEEQANLRTELEELKVTVAELELNLEALKTKVEEEIVTRMESGFAEVYAMLDTINAKLALLDPDEINDSFANLEEQTDMILKELADMKLAAEQFQKEARINFNKISNVNDLLNKLDQTKADKSKMYELLEMKADVDMLMNKLDRSEFVSVVGDMKETLERLGIKVKINEEEMNQNFGEVRHDLSLKMYTEDFITATEPIRNRIKALMYELEGVKRITLTRLFPDAPGIAKCISCNRGAHMAGPKYLGDARVDFLQEVQPRIKVDKSGKSSRDSSAQGVRLPPVELDSVPIPPSDKRRETDPLRLPLLFAKARPQVGLAHERRRNAIDKKLAAYFATRPVRPCDGQHTRTLPQQRGLDFSAVQLPRAEEKEEVLLEGADGGLYRGALYNSTEEDDEEVDCGPRSVIESSSVSPTVVSLHVDGEPLQKPAPFAKPSGTFSRHTRKALRSIKDSNDPGKVHEPRTSNEGVPE